MTTSLSSDEIRRIDAVFEAAAAHGRWSLYEHEVYRILDLLGLPTPFRIFLPAHGRIEPDMLKRFSTERIVLKAAARNLTHKHKVGGVKIVFKDLDFIRFTADRMGSNLRTSGYRVEGIQLTEWIDYSKDLGNEVLLGFRESDAFGPVISFSKGGTDAEHFAKHFSSPNLILAPIDRLWAEALLNSTHIREKYDAEGRKDDVGKIVTAGLAFSRLAAAFSDSLPGESRFTIQEFEVNPFVFDPRGQFIALDGFAAFKKRRSPKRKSASLPPLSPFFDPSGIAVVGVSRSDTRKPGNIILANLLNLGREDIYAVNIQGGEITAGSRRLPVYRHISDIEAPIDLAVVAVPADHTLRVVEACAKKTVKALILISGGFSETRGDDALDRQILDIARSAGMRIIGPNCLGIVYAGRSGSPGINTFFVPEEKFQLNFKISHRLAILSQSGALGITEIYNLRHAISPKAVVSYGNQLDVDPGDLVRHFNDDPGVDVIGCYIEGFKSGAGRKFFDIAAGCRKPVIVYKAGRTEEGMKATESHTASIAGEYAVAKAAMKQAGLIVADTMLDHGEYIKTFAMLDPFEVTGNRVAIIANAGYEKTYAADNLGGLVLASFDPPTATALRAILPPYVTVDPMLDLTPMAGDDLFEACIGEVMASKAVDALFISIVPHSSLIHTTDEEIGRNRENIAARIVRQVHRHQKPTVVSINVVSGADAVYNRFGQILDEGGVPTFLSARRAMASLSAFIRYRMARQSKAFSEWLK
ncbi:MAG: acetate--CoA ligase family protein [Desulfobacterales bacterium]|jgi:acyl-CoA synthetase (NDP forming)